MPGVPLPTKVPGKVVQTVAQVDAVAGWADVFVTTDQGWTWHSYYRPGLGWQGPEPIVAPT